jgi:hypothetical protein
MNRPHSLKPSGTRQLKGSGGDPLLDASGRAPAVSYGILTDSKSGFAFIRDAAGGGKTTTPFFACGSSVRRGWRGIGVLGLTDPIRVLVLTYNRTLESA